MYYIRQIPPLQHSIPPWDLLLNYGMLPMMLDRVSSALYQYGSIKRVYLHTTYAFLKSTLTFRFFHVHFYKLWIEQNEWIIAAWKFLTQLRDTPPTRWGLHRKHNRYRGLPTHHTTKIHHPVDSKVSLIMATILRVINLKNRSRWEHKWVKENIIHSMPWIKK